MRSRSWGLSGLIRAPALVDNRSVPQTDYPPGLGGCQGVHSADSAVDSAALPRRGEERGGCWWVSGPGRSARVTPGSGSSGGAQGGPDPAGPGAAGAQQDLDHLADGAAAAGTGEHVIDAAADVANGIGGGGREGGGGEDPGGAGGA